MVPNPNPNPNIYFSLRLPVGRGGVVNSVSLFSVFWATADG